MVRALAAPMLVAAGLAQAVGLGEVTQQSALGSALRIVVPIIVGPGENMAGECLRLVPSGRSSDGIPEVTTARVAFERTADGARAVVTSSRATVDPVLRLTLQAGCDSTVRREYTLLMDPPVIGAPVAAPPEAPVPAPRVLTAPSSAPASAAVAPAAGAGSGAAAAPKARPAPRRRAATTVAAVPGVPATAIAGAAAAPAAAPKTEAAPARRAAAPAAAAPPPAPAAVPAPQPKLTVSSAAPAGEAMAPGKGQAPIPVERGPAARAGSPTAETAAALDAEAAALQQRVVELTALVDKMQAEMKEAETKQAAQAARLAAEKAARDAPMAVVGRWWGENWPFLVAVVGIAVLLAALLLARRRHAADAGVGAAAANTARTTTIPPPGRGPASGMGAAALKAAEAVGAKLHTTFGQGATAKPTEVDVSELSHVTEEAGVYLAFNRPDRAIDVLREHIKTKPNSLPAAWLMLLDLYHDQKREQEFRALADEFHARFNAQTPAWEAYKQRAQGDRGLEGFPHIIRQLIVLWGRPECREFLDHLLHENRDGRRGGFSLATYEDILFLRHLADTLGADSDAARRKRAQAAAAPGPAPGSAAAPKRQPTLDLELALDEDMLKSGRNPSGAPPAKS